MIRACKVLLKSRTLCCNFTLLVPVSMPRETRRNSFDILWLNVRCIPAMLMLLPHSALVAECTKLNDPRKAVKHTSLMRNFPAVGHGAHLPRRSRWMPLPLCPAVAEKLEPFRECARPTFPPPSPPALSSPRPCSGSLVLAPSLCLLSLTD